MVSSRKENIMKRFAIAVIAMGLASQVAFAAEEGGAKGRHERGEQMAKELNLTEAQKKQVEEIRNSYKDQFQGMKEKMKAAKEDLSDSLKSPQKGAEYQKTLLEKFKTVQALKNEMGEKRFQMALEIREILNRDQIAKFRAMHEFRKH
jgi:Spy/CpxP family protein refolding chaperone